MSPFRGLFLASAPFGVFDVLLYFYPPLPRKATPLSKADKLAIKEAKRESADKIAKIREESSGKTGTTLGMGLLGAGAHGAIKGLGYDDAVTVGGYGTSDLVGLGVSLYVGYNAFRGVSSPRLAPLAIGMTAPMVSNQAEEFFRGMKGSAAA